MLPARVLRASPAFAALRPFTTTTSAAGRAPSIRDITPHNAAAFDARQKEFRENLELSARKRKQEQESQSVNSSSVQNPPRDRAREFSLTPTAPLVSNASGVLHRPSLACLWTF